MSSVYKPEMLEEWAEMCVAEKAYPIEITISIPKSGKYTIEQTIDGRKLRGQFVTWMAKEFKDLTNIVPPKRNTTKAYNKMWTQPLEALLRQAIYTGGIEYDNLRPREKYNTLNGMCFRLLLKDIVTKQNDQGLTIYSPQSIEKVGAGIAANGNHYRLAVRRLEAESS